MRLTIITPTAVVADIAEVRHVRAEDESGSFGILPGHAEFLTVLAVSVLTWTLPSGVIAHAAVRGGMLRVVDGVQVATPEAVLGDDLADLEQNVVAAFRAAEEADKVGRSALSRLELAAMRHIQRYLHPDAGKAGA